MTTIHYTPGPWRAAVTPQGVAVLPSGVTGETLERIRASLAAGHGLGAVLESLTGAFGTSLRSIPPFAVAAVEGGSVRLAVRGPLVAAVTESGGGYEVSGADVTTWSERVVASAVGVVIETGAETHAPGERFVIADGVVLCSRVELTPDGSGGAVEVQPDEASMAAAPTTSIPTPPALSTEAPTGDAPTSAASPVASPAVSPAVEAVIDDLESTRDELPDDAYDHLWGATVVKSVEDAAVRDLDDEEPVEVAPAPSTAPDIVAAAPSSSTTAPEPPAPAAPAAPVAPSTGLIDSLPDFGAVGAPTPGFDARTVPPAPAAPAPALAPEASAVTPGAAAVADDDHDGLTVTVSELEALRRLESAAPAPAADSGDGADAVSLGRIVLSTGDVHPLDRPVVIGRRPRANRVQPDHVPLLVTVPSPEQDISRNHLEVRLEGRHVLVVDLDTTNGSVRHRVGAPPLRLAPNEPVLVLDGDVVDLGDGVTVTFEDIP
ncbi:FHA domain-containing protein [Herbiconiux moechotypicola]|uniref:FHA domain-containing protein n=1 Tax=Herbiconiux moechotypicola TaxID=637393 RepID=A0ABN3DCF1_9MICO|nr:FHA domain-containing protein [Herbiconiux moechotypicola]MCS5728731.1 FHA domain-containing protein [Herbiconiux moechotypicola]